MDAKTNSKTNTKSPIPTYNAAHKNDSRTRDLTAAEKHKNRYDPSGSSALLIRDTSLSSSASEMGLIAESRVYTMPQEHGRTKSKKYVGRMLSRTHSLVNVVDSISLTSISSSLFQFREDFDEFKCKMQIFGESLNLCKCIASDFQSQMKWMEKRLQNLEKRYKLNKEESNYSTIIKKNKMLSQKVMNDARIQQVVSKPDKQDALALRFQT